MSAFLYGDVLEPAGDGVVSVRARVSLLSSEQGGPTAPRRAKYRPNHNFGGADDRVFYIGQVEIPEITEIRPGESHVLVVNFFNVRGIADLAKVGAKWRIQEGPKLIASAEVLELIPPA